MALLENSRIFKKVEGKFLHVINCVFIETSNLLKISYQNNNTKREDNSYKYYILRNPTSPKNNKNGIVKQTDI